MATRIDTKDLDHILADLASLVCQLVNPGIGVTIAQRTDPACPPRWYVPSVKRARGELALESWVSLEEAIEKTVRWLNNRNREA